MEAKTGVEEKRVKSTIIRRRAKAEEIPAPTPEPQAPVETAPAVAATSPVPVSSTPAQAPVAAKPTLGTAKPGSTTEVKRPLVGGVAPPRPGVSSIGDDGIDDDVPAKALTEKEKAAVKKIVRKKTRDELEMEMIDRAGGLKKAAELMEVAPERLERVFRPDRNAKKKKGGIVRRDFKKTELTTPKAIKRVVRIDERVLVYDLAHRMSVKAAEILKKLVELGVMASINQSIDADTATLVAEAFGYEVENVAFSEQAVFDKNDKKNEDDGEKVSRPPIVTVMGHVDHGKTTLLDTIRKAQVAEGEAGGITQHIGAYEVLTPKGSITFIDTPGHEAFTAMRARGASITDIVILVVAADDGLMPQTIEAINHAKAGKVPIIVAVNKMDKPDADIQRVERGLMEHSMVSEKLGGDTIIVPVSAKTGKGIDELLEMLVLQSEVLQLKASPTKTATGTVVEARLDKGRGPVSTVIIQDGTLNTGDIVIAGTAYGKVRALVDAQGVSIKEAGPSKPVEVLGLSTVPMAGDKVNVVESEDSARQIAEHRAKKIKDAKQPASAPIRLEDLYAKSLQEKVPEVRVILKGDVQGSIEALREAIVKMSTEKVKITVLHTGVGAVVESDVMLAKASQAIIVGFNVRPDSKGRELAEREKVQIRSYQIIYEVVDDLKKAMEGMLKPTYQEHYLGRAEVRQVFTISKIGTIAGCFVNDGKILRAASVRLLRDGKVITTGKLSSLKRFKDDAREVLQGLECGMGIDNYNDLKPNDIIEAFQIEEIATKL